MTEVVNATSLNKDLLEAGRNLQRAIDTARETSVEYVRTKHEYQYAWDRAFLDADGTEQAKKSQANVATYELSKLADLALEQKRNARLQVDAYQSIVSAYQSVAATARAEARFVQTGAM